MSSPILPSAAYPEYELWRQGYGVIQHTETTCDRVQNLASRLIAAGHQPDTATVYRKLADLDRLTSAASGWLCI